MSKPVNKLGVIKDATLQVGAAITRLKKATKHVSKINDLEHTKSLLRIISQLETFECWLVSELNKERIKVAMNDDASEN